MLAATYTRAIGRAVASRWRRSARPSRRGGTCRTPTQSRSPPAACELHPAALFKAVELRSTREALRAANEAAARAGVRTVPAIGVGGTVYAGEAAVEQAARAAA